MSRNGNSHKEGTPKFALVGLANHHRAFPHRPFSPVVDWRDLPRGDLRLPYLVSATNRAGSRREWLGRACNYEQQLFGLHQWLTPR